MNRLIIFLFAVGSAFAQTPREFVPEIQAYLGLSNEQMAKLNMQNRELSQWVGDRQNRISQVQREIAEETAKSPLDPGALGVRYAEVESIRREIKERTDKQIVANVALLTDPQKAKLKALEEALKLQSTGSQAKAIRLLADECSGGRYIYDPLGMGLGLNAPCIYGMFGFPATP
ncbi:MAG: hypothetical protein HYX27_15915 [Acidobacteria bacterium]|nr:hypothetical protein [Acidobacteriota bacterium]